MPTRPSKEDLSELYKQCSEYLATADQNMVRSSKEAFADSVRVRHMEVRDIVIEAHELGVIDKDTLFKDGAWIGHEIEDVTVLDSDAPFYKATITTPATGRTLRADLPDHHVNNVHSPYVFKAEFTHLDNIISHIRNAAKRIRIDEATPASQECHLEV